ncbi:MAG: hypothetical protein AB7L18_07885, partial [Hyphomicrobiaceae bacterium]
LSIVLALIAAPLPAAVAMADDLSGSWSGGGSVHYNNTRERASCRASYFRTGGSSYSMNASCATKSGKVNQTATLSKVGNGRYAGSFFNSQYGVSGSISVVVKGRSQSVRLSGGGGGGSFSLSRR